VLAGIVVMQNRRIKDMQKPKYGFLGKSLYAFVMLSVLVGGIGFVYYNTTTKTNEFVTVNADQSFDANIVITQIDSYLNEYKFNAIPLVDDKEWGANGYKFDVYWTVTGDNVVTRIELGLTKENKGGVTVQLTKGTYTIKTSIFVGDVKIDKSTTLEVE
jgi:hypothetical protein